MYVQITRHTLVLVECLHVFSLLYIFAINPLLPFSDQHMAEVVQDSGCSDLTGFAPLTDAFLSSHAQENMIETN